MTVKQEFRERFATTPMALVTPEFHSHSNGSLNVTWESPLENGSGEDLAAIYTIGTLLCIMCLIGVMGNLHTLVVMCNYLHSSTSMYIYIINLALADILYLLTIPFIVGTYFIQEWYFGEIGCRILFSLDFLTMHASIFTLTIMSTERYFAVLKPLDMMKRSKNYQKTIAMGTWLVSLLLTLPMLIMIQLVQRDQKKICLPTWGKLSYQVYLTILFGTSIVGPGVILGFLYIRLARTYWFSQIASFKQTKRLLHLKVFYLIFTIVLVFWACFLPFWVWQLLSQYCESLPLSAKATRIINYLTTCLTYSNSCMNPFLYTLMTKNYREYLQNQHPSTSSRGSSPSGYFQRQNWFRKISGRSLSTSSQHCTETFRLSKTSREAIST